MNSSDIHIYFGPYELYYGVNYINGPGYGLNNSPVETANYLFFFPSIKVTIQSGGGSPVK